MNVLPLCIFFENINVAFENIFNHGYLKKVQDQFTRYKIVSRQYEIIKEEKDDPFL